MFKINLINAFGTVEKITAKAFYAFTFVLFSACLAIISGAAASSAERTIMATSLAAAKTPGAVNHWPEFFDSSHLSQDWQQYAARDEITPKLQAPRRTLVDLTNVPPASDYALLLFTVQADNIQVREDWAVREARNAFYINNNGELYLTVLFTEDTILVATVYVVDSFQDLNTTYQNLTATAVITVDVMSGDLSIASPPRREVVAGVAEEVYVFSAQGGTPPYTYNLLANPDANAFVFNGSTLSVNTNATIGEYQFTVEVMDAADMSVTVVATVSVGAAATIQVNGGGAVLVLSGQEREIADGATVLFNPKSKSGVQVSAKTESTVMIGAAHDAWQITLYDGSQAYFAGVVDDSGEIIIAVSLAGDSDSNVPLSHYIFDDVVVAVTSSGARIYSRNYSRQWYLVIDEGVANLLSSPPSEVNLLAFGDGRWNNHNGVLLKEKEPFMIDALMATVPYRYIGDVAEIRANNGVAPSFSLVGDSNIFTVTTWRGSSSEPWLPGLLAIIAAQEGPLTLSVTVAAEDRLGEMLGNYGYAKQRATVTVAVEVEAPPLMLLESALSLSPLMVTASGGYLPYTYQIITGNEDNYFDLVAHSGKLRFAGNLDMGIYSLTVQVVDGRGNTDDGLVVVHVMAPALVANFHKQPASPIVINNADDNIFVQPATTGIIGNIVISGGDSNFGNVYSLIVNPNNAFSIAGNNLILVQQQAEGQSPLHVVMEVAKGSQYVRVAITINIGIAGLAVVRDTFYTGLGDTGLVGRIQASGDGDITLVVNDNNAFDLDGDSLFLIKEQDSAVSLTAVARVSIGGESLDLSVAVHIREPAEEMLYAMGGFAEASIFAEDDNGRRRQYHSDILVSPDGDGEDWITLRADVPFGERAFFGNVVHNGKIYVMVGWAKYWQRNPEIWSSVDGLTWELEVTNPGFAPGRRGGFLALSHNGSIYVIAGDKGDDGGYQNDVWASANGDEWILVTNNAGFAKRGYFAGVVHNGTMFLFGGYDGDEDSAPVYNDVWASTDGANWEKLSSPFGQDICCHAAVSYNGKIVVMGGDYEITRRSSAVWSSADGISWELVSNGAMLVRHSHSAAVYNGKIFVLGNRYYDYGPATERDVVQSSADGGITWTTHDRWWNYSDTGDTSPWRRSFGGVVAFTPNTATPPIDESLPLSGSVEMMRDTFYLGLGDVGPVGRIKVSGGEGVTFFSLVSNDNNAFAVDTNGFISLINEQTSEGSLRAEINVSTFPDTGSFNLAVTVQVRAPAEEMLYAMGGRRESPSFEADDQGRQRQILGDILVSPDGYGEDWLTLTANAPFGARYSFGAVVHNDKMFVIGGFVKNWQRRNEVWSSDDGLNWQLETNTPRFANANGDRGGFSALSHNGSIYIIAGYDNGPKNDVWASADGTEWMLATADAGFSPREDFAGVVHNGKMFVIGGYYDGEEDSIANDVWASADGAKWTMLSSPFGSEGISHSKAVSYDGKIIVMGGNNNDSSVWSSVDGIEWELVSQGQMLSRHTHAAVVYDGEIFVMGNRYYAEGPLTQRRVVESSSDGGLTWQTRDNWWNYSDTGDNSPWRRSWGGVLAFTPKFSASTIGEPLSGTVDTVRSVFYTGLGDTGLAGRIKARGGSTTQYNFSLVSGNAVTVDSNGLIFMNQAQTAAGVLNAVVRVTDGSESVDLAMTIQVRAPAEEMLYAMGGLRESPSFEVDSEGDQRQRLRDILVSPDGNGEDWLTLTAQAPFGEKNGFGAVVHNGNIYIVGGWAYDYQKSIEVWSSADGLNWQLETSNGFHGGVLAALSYNNLIYAILDGYNGNEVWSSANGVQWTLKGQNVFSAPRSSSGVVVHNGTIFVIAGDYYDGENDDYVRYGDVWASTDGLDWEPLNSSPFGEGVCCLAAVSYGDKILVLGGAYDSDVSSAVWSSVDGINWDLVSDGEMMRRYAHSAVVSNGQIFVMGNRYYADGPLTQRRVVESSADGGQTWQTRDNWWNYSDTGDNSPWRRSHGIVVAFTPNN